MGRGFRQLLRDPSEHSRPRRRGGSGRGTRHRRSGCATIEGCDSGRCKRFYTCAVPGGSGTTPEEPVGRRTKPSFRSGCGKAADEIRNYTSYDYVLVNDDLSRSMETLAAIVAAERVRRIRVEPVVRSILASFE